MEEYSNYELEVEYAIDEEPEISHKSLYNKRYNILSKYNKIGDNYVQAFSYIISHNDKLWRLRDKVFDFKESRSRIGIIQNEEGKKEIDFVKIGYLSSSERALLSLALNMFNDRYPAEISEVFQYLNEANCRIAVEAMRLRYLF